MLKELEKNGLSINILNTLSYKSSLEKSLKNSLRRFEVEDLFNEVTTMIRFYRGIETLEVVDLDYRIKSFDSCLRKYEKFYPEMRVEKVFNDILGFRMLVDNYDTLLNGNIPDGIRIVDMSKGKAKDDGYRGVHIYFQPDHYHYPIEIQSNTYYDRQLNNWLHKYLYKRGYSDLVGRILRQEYEYGKILKEQDFQEVLKHVLSGSQEV
ncbi:nucleotidyltransferase family protein [Lacrimispora brassicae]